VGERAEGNLRRPEREPVAVTEPPAALLLAVDGDLGLPVALFEVEVATVEDDLRVVLGDVGQRDAEIVVERFAYRRDRFVDAVLARPPLRWEVFEGRH